MVEKDNKSCVCERLLPFAVDGILYLRTAMNPIEITGINQRVEKASKSSGAKYEAQDSPTKPGARTIIGIALTEIREADCFQRFFNKRKSGDINQFENFVN